jgi:NADPH2:quinone reductase
LVVTNTSLVGVFAGGYSRQDLDRMHRQLSDLISTGKLRNAVTATIPFDQLPRGLQSLADNTVVGKLVLEVQPSHP